MSRSFHLGDVLSITTGLLVSPRGVDALYDVLNFMTSDDLMTHQLPRAIDEASPDMLRQHPDLADVPVPEEFEGREHVERWLAEQVARFGEYRTLVPLASADHARIDPLTELRMMAPDKPIIVVASDVTRRLT
jgi:hypothetical protein